MRSRSGELLNPALGDSVHVLQDLLNADTLAIDITTIEALSYSLF